MKKTPLLPRASLLTEAMRDIGYSLEAAVADIIDNSITAMATKVDIWFDFDAEEPALGIVDNGSGMNCDELMEAMRYGSVHPRSKRAADDLGRFGLGLKTASLSQCRCLTVVSRKNGVYAGIVWDLDTVSEHDEWLVNVLDAKEIHSIPFIEKLDNSGTLVQWRNLDRLCDGKLQKNERDIFLKKIELVEKHLSLVFHRFLAGEVKQKKLDIFVNGHKIEPFDPFCLNNKATQHLQEEIVNIKGHRIMIQPYILPHHSKLSPKEYDYYRDRSEFVNNSGGYIYRNSRLMVWGNWFRLAPKAEKTKLARFRIDFPNALDEEWTIDIKKSRADPPPQVTSRLRQIITKITDQSTRVIIGKVKNRLSENVIEPFWVRYSAHGGTLYVINRDHSILKAVEKLIGIESQKRLLWLIDIIEKSLPVEAIYADYSENPKGFEKASVGDAEEIKSKLNMLYDILSDEKQLEREEFRKIASRLKPFSEYPQELKDIINERFGG